MRPKQLIIAELEQRDLLEPLARIAKNRHLTVAEVLTDSRDHSILAARFDFYRHLHDEAGFSKRRIAILFGTHHTTVMNGLRRALVRAPREARPNEKRTAS